MNQKTDYLCIVVCIAVYNLMIQMVLKNEEFI